MCEDFDDYVVNLASPKGWGTVLELEIISRIFRFVDLVLIVSGVNFLVSRLDFLTYFGPDPPIQITQNGYKRQLMLCVTGTCFYDAVYTKTHIENLGFCQCE